MRCHVQVDAGVAFRGAIPTSRAHIARQGGEVRSAKEQGQGDNAADVAEGQSGATSDLRREEQHLPDEEIAIREFVGKFDR